MIGWMDLVLIATSLVHETIHHLIIKLVHLMKLCQQVFPLNVRISFSLKLIEHIWVMDCWSDRNYLSN